MNLILIGYRGTGKSTVARRLALRLGWDWVDSDVEIELQAGKSIAAIFAEDGEAAFRDLETAVIGELGRRNRHVLGTGGGAVLREENREILRESGKIVWLQATAETIAARIETDTTTSARRPNLTNQGGLPEIRELLAARAPIYRGCADLAVDTEEKEPAAVVEEILTRLQLPAVEGG